MAERAYRATIAVEFRARDQTEADRWLAHACAYWVRLSARVVRADPSKPVTVPRAEVVAQEAERLRRASARASEVDDVPA